MENKYQNGKIYKIVDNTMVLQLNNYVKELENIEDITKNIKRVMNTALLSTTYLMSSV